MQRLKKLFVNAIAVMLMLSACLGLSACQADIRKIELDIRVYNYEEEGQFENVTLTVALYRHLAPKTVDAILGYVKDGYYDNTVFYKFTDSKYDDQIMIGDIVVKDGEIDNNAIKPQLPGEFEKGGTIGSNLINVEGAVGLWRTWYDWNNETYKLSGDSMKTGRATWYMPTSTISSYNDYFCIFALIDLQNENNSEAWELIQAALTENTEEYTVYYTGEYNANDADANDGHGLTFNCETSAAFEEKEESLNVFETQGSNQLTCYNKYEIAIPEVDGVCAATIVSAKIK